MAQPLADEPRDLLLDDSNDLVITSDLAFTTGIQAVVQSCRIALQMFRGEWFLDLDAGIPYWDNILGARSDIGVALARDEFRQALLAVNGVINILRLDVEFDRATRTLEVVWQVNTALGETPIDVIEVEV